jgi:putative membrane protein
MAVKKGKLVLCIDRDNDMYEKAKIAGPIIGRDANLEAATKLALADPTEPDSNTIFRAINIYDSLSGDAPVQVATLTGSPSLGFQADKEIAAQLERVLSDFPADSCIFVSDGASDEQIMPIIRSRLKIDGVEIVVMKQAKELEKTYFVILEKLKEPHYARLIFGTPALLLIIFAASRYLGLGIESVAAIIAVYLGAKAFGIEERVLRLASGFKFSVDKISSIVYIFFFIMLLFSGWAASQRYSEAVENGLSAVKTTAVLVKTLANLLSISFMILLAGKMIDILNDKEQRKIELSRYGLYAITTVIVWFMLSIASDWVLNLAPPYVSFSDFLTAILASMVFGFVGIWAMKNLKVSLVSKLKLENKEIFSENGAYLGKIMGVDPQESSVIFRSPLGQKLTLPLEDVTSVGERVMVKA